MSGNSESISSQVMHESDVEGDQKAKGFHLHFRNGRAIWTEF